jgi:hypothetical protein
VGGASTDAPLDNPRALQILSTEHWSLLAARSLAYNEAFTRAAMFLTFLSATLVVMGFLVGPLGLTGTMAFIAAVLLSCDLFIGLATLVRLSDASHEELVCVRGMNRIRHAYREMVPGLAPYFVSGFHDDLAGVLAAYGAASRPGVIESILHGLSTTMGMVGAIDALLAGAIAVTVTLGLVGAPAVSAVAGVVAFLVTFGLGVRYGMRGALVREATMEARFPTPPRAAS